jgi:uncharacterized protein YndB with AHSA1/START domain
MPTVSRKRTVPAPRGEVWEILSDPYHLPRWWPKVERVEEVTDDTWTKVMISSRGKAVRLDYTRVEADPQRRVVWRHEVDESPFERVLADSLLEIELEPDGDEATRVRMTLDQKLRGKSRFGGGMVRRAAKRQLKEALDGLARAFGEPV